MIRLRAITWAIGIWATAISTLFAGMPHLQCRCPDGRINSFCLSILIPSTRCVRSCCAAPAGTQEERDNKKPAAKSCCCHQASRRAVNGPSEHIRPMGCQKTIVKAQMVARADIVRVSGNALVSLLSNVLGSIPYTKSQPEFDHLTVATHWSPPPSDLVITLGRLLI